jgi:predicted transcriptional regulator
MKNKEIIDCDEIKVTEKGKQFHKDYSKINDLIQELSIQN